MNIKKIGLICLIACQCFTKSFGQDPVFSQFYAASLFLNPAFAADKQNTNFTINHKTYTNREFAAYNLSQLTALVPLKLKFMSKNPNSENSSGVGFSFYREATGSNGELVTMGFMGTISHCVRIAKSHFLSFGLQASFINRKQGANFDWGSQYVQDVGFDKNIQASLGMPNLTKNFPTFNAGMLWFMNNTSMQSYLRKLSFDAFAGISISNLNMPNQSFYTGEVTRLPMNWKIHGGLKFSINPQMSIFPNILWVRQNLDNQLNIGAYTSIKPKTVDSKDNSYNAILGLWYRAGESVIASIGSQFQDFKISLSYDFVANRKFTFKNRGKGALELSLKYTLPTTKAHLQRGYVYPSF
jgi:type IX secretion system PorP/SprF family membrane protein